MKKPADTAPELTQSTVILGIDPGSSFTGFGAVRARYGVAGDASGDGAGRVELVSFGVITPPGHLSFNERIAIIAGEIEALLARLKPTVTVVEKIFLGKNADSAFKLGHTRGASIASAIRGGSEVYEYATRSVKKGITGNGNATKEQVQLILFAALGVKVKAAADASDALALAFYHARNMDVQRAHVSSALRTETRARTKSVTRSVNSEGERNP